MGVWHKTLFYLGLVDEDADQYDRSATYPDAGSSRYESERDLEPPEYPGAPQRVEQPARPIGGRRVQRPEARSAATGERAPGGHPDDESERPRGVQGRRVEPPMAVRRRPPSTSTDRALADSGVVVSPVERPLVRTFGDSDLESEVIVARSYSDAQTVADHLRASVPVVLDLRKVEPAMVRRLVDFASGLTYALGGSMRKIGQGVVLVTPANVNISRDEKRRLRELGYHEAPGES
jgi:FtsZ-interacting cell division protein YlmF